MEKKYKTTIKLTLEWNPCHGNGDIAIVDVHDVSGYVYSTLGNELKYDGLDVEVTDMKVDE